MPADDFQPHYVTNDFEDWGNLAPPPPRAVKLVSVVPYGGMGVFRATWLTKAGEEDEFARALAWLDENDDPCNVPIAPGETCKGCGGTRPCPADVRLAEYRGKLFEEVQRTIDEQRVLVTRDDDDIEATVIRARQLGAMRQGLAIAVRLLDE